MSVGAVSVENRNGNGSVNENDSHEKVFGPPGGGKFRPQYEGETNSLIFAQILKDFPKGKFLFFCVTLNNTSTIKIKRKILDIN